MKTPLKPYLLAILVVLITFVSAVASSMLTENPLFRKLIAAILPFTLYVVYTIKRNDSALNFQHTLIPKYLLWLMPWLVCISIYIRMPVLGLPELGFFFFIVAECFIGALTEELMFRGVLFRMFQKAKFPIYLLVSSLTFGSLHFAEGITDILQATIIGLAYCLARLSGCPFIVLVLCHTLTNFPKHVVIYDNLPAETLIAIGERIESTSYIEIIYLSIIVIVCLTYLLIPKHWSNHLNKSGFTINFLGKTLEI